MLGGATIVENNIVQTIGSAAGAVATMVFVLPAFVIVGWWSEIPYWETMWVCAIGGVLGVMLSVPMRRALVIDTDLPYPEGVAGAEILRVGMGDAEGERENRVGLATIMLGAAAGALFGLLAALRVAAGEVAKNFQFGSGVSGIGGSLSLGPDRHRPPDRACDRNGDADRSGHQPLHPAPVAQRGLARTDRRSRRDGVLATGPLRRRGGDGGGGAVVAGPRSPGRSSAAWPASPRPRGRARRGRRCR